MRSRPIERESPQEMFPFGNNSSNLEPLFRKPPSFHVYNETPNPNSKPDESPFFSNFPSPFFDEHELPLNQIFQTDEKIHDPTKKEISKVKRKTDEQQTTPPRRRNLAAAPRKRTGKKDRHSKICTAQGIRDRRMRLSLQVARKFFDLQDMLGYDKASKTIEWLFSKSKKAINELAKDYNISDSKSESFVSECEVVSETEENSNNEVKEDLEFSEHNQIKSPEKPRKSIFEPNIRDSREKARARARSRTEEKLMGKRIEYSKEMCKSSPNCQDLEKLGFEDQERVSAYDAGDYSPLVYQPSDVGTIEKLLGNSSSSASDYPISCYIDPNWDCLLSNDRLNYAVTNTQASVGGNTNSIYSDTATDLPLFHQ